MIEFLVGSQIRASGRSAVALLFAMLVQAFPVYAAPKEANLDLLHNVQCIRVGDMGTTDESARFRLLLREELVARGFTVVDSPAPADATFSGVYIERPSRFQTGTLGIVTIYLKTEAGVQLWSADFHNPVVFKGTTDYARYRAHDVARELRQACDRSKKAAESSKAKP